MAEERTGRWRRMPAVRCPRRDHGQQSVRGNWLTENPATKMAIVQRIEVPEPGRFSVVEAAALSPVRAARGRDDSLERTDSGALRVHEAAEPRSRGGSRHHRGSVDRPSPITTTDGLSTDEPTPSASASQEPEPRSRFPARAASRGAGPHRASVLATPAIRRNGPGQPVRVAGPGSASCCRRPCKSPRCTRAPPRSGGRAGEHAAGRRTGSGSPSTARCPRAAPPASPAAQPSTIARATASLRATTRCIGQSVSRTADRRTWSPSLVASQVGASACSAEIAAWRQL